MRNLKKVISSVAATALVASSASAFAVTFPDVDASASYANAVDTLVALKVVRGDDKGLFNPDNNVTRAEFTTMAVGALDETAAAQAQMTSEFTDAANTQQHWAAGYIAQGVADGFINGMGDGRFAPDEQVTFAQAAKMLVAAVGYTSYAEAAGGWPSGYVSQASSLGITKGVSATNDTALTRAQCAVMVYNAMQVPLCVIDEWETQVTLTGTVQTPVLKKLDGFSKSNHDYQTLLTDKHDAYLVKGRVMVSPKGGAAGVDKDEVRYNIEVADNFDDKEYTSRTASTSEKVKIGNTNAADLLFTYTEAIVQKDEDSDEYTFLSITPYGNSKTVEFAADDVATYQDENNLTQYGSTGQSDFATYGKIPVFKSSSTSSTTKYDLASVPKIYVNGIEVANAVVSNTVTNASGAAEIIETLHVANFNDAMDKYVINNKTGSVQLVDRTEPGSTSTDGKYEYIMVTYYVDTVVDYTQTTSSVARVAFKQNPSTVDNKMEWDPDDDDVDIAFIKDGAEIAYTDLAENDVLSIQYDVYGDSKSLRDRDYYRVLVSSSVVEGNVTSRDTKRGDQTITIDGTIYDINEDMEDATNFELGTSYAIYIDAFGYVAYSDEGTSEKTYGAVVAMYKSNGDDYATVRLITSDAKVVSYECKDVSEQNKFYTMLKNGVEPIEVTEGTRVRNIEAYPSSNPSITKTDASANIKAGKTVCTYKISSGKIKFDKYQDAAANSGKVEYKVNNSKLGSYNINDSTTKLIDMDEYMDPNNSGNSVSTLTLADFEDEAEYDAYFFDKNKDSVYRFVIVFGGISSIRPETQIAVVKSVDGQKDSESGNTCKAYTVVRNNQEVALLVDDLSSMPTLNEGDVIAYTTGSEGYVENNNLYRIYTHDVAHGAANYSVYEKDTNNNDVLTGGLLFNTLGKVNFNEMLNKKNFNNNTILVDTTPTVNDAGDAIPTTDSYITTKAKNNGALAIAYNGNGSASKEVYVYFGIVHRKTASNVELFTKQSAVWPTGTCNVSDAVDFSLNGANIYTYDYNEREGKGGRVQLGNSGTQTTSVFNNAYDTDKNVVTWSALDGSTPQLALIKEVDGDVTDAIFFAAP